jgi:hypothetical protein
MLLGTVLSMLPVPRAYCVETLNFPPTTFDILSADTGLLVGHGRYTFDRVSGGFVLRGDNRYLSGDYDLEEDHMVATDERPLPVLTSFRHSFHHRDGALYMEGRMDAESGIGSCAQSIGGKMSVTSEQLNFPADTYAGVSVLVPIQDFLRREEGSGILKLHVFTCAPGPRLPSVEVEAEPATVTWQYYPGALVKTNIKADFGFFTFVIQPFLPKLAAWFDPSSRWLLVGAQLERHYRGDKIILVRSRNANSSAPVVEDKTPPAAVRPR